MRLKQASHMPAFAGLNSTTWRIAFAEAVAAPPAGAVVLSTVHATSDTSKSGNRSTTGWRQHVRDLRFAVACGAGTE